MWDLLRFFSILLTGVVLGFAGYFLGVIAFPHLADPVARMGGALAGGLLGIIAAVWVNSRRFGHVEPPQ